MLRPRARLSGRGSRPPPSSFWFAERRPSSFVFRGRDPARSNHENPWPLSDRHCVHVGRGAWRSHDCSKGRRNRTRALLAEQSVVLSSNAICFQDLSIHAPGARAPSRCSCRFWFWRALALLARPRWGDAARRCVARLLRVEIGVYEDELVRWRGPEQLGALSCLAHPGYP